MRFARRTGPIELNEKSTMSGKYNGMFLLLTVEDTFSEYSNDLYTENSYSLEKGSSFGDKRWALQIPILC